VLLTVEVGSEREVRKALKEIPDGKEVHTLYGQHDLIVCVEAETLQELKDVINKRIRSLDEIRSTITMICIKEGDIRRGKISG